MNIEELALLIHQYVFDEKHEIGRLSQKFLLVQGKTISVEALELAVRILDYANEASIQREIG